MRARSWRGAQPAGGIPAWGGRAGPGLGSDSSQHPRGVAPAPGPCLCRRRAGSRERHAPSPMEWSSRGSWAFAGDRTSSWRSAVGPHRTRMRGSESSTSPPSPSPSNRSQGPSGAHGCPRAPPRGGRRSTHNKCRARRRLGRTHGRQIGRPRCQPGPPQTPEADRQEAAVGSPRRLPGVPPASAAREAQALRSPPARCRHRRTPTPQTTGANSVRRRRARKLGRMTGQP